MDSRSKKSNRRNTNKNERGILPSQIQRLEKTREVQKALRTLCDREDDDDSSDEKSFIFVRSRRKTDSKDRHIKQDNTRPVRQKEILQINLTDSSSEGSSSVSESSSTSHEKHKGRGNRRNQKVKYIQDRRDSNRSAQIISKIAVQGRNVSKNIISSDSDHDSIDVSSNKTAKRKYTVNSNIRVEKRIQSIISSHRINMPASDSEGNENDSTNKALNVSKNLPEDIIQRNEKKNVNSSHTRSAKDKANKYDYLTSESENDAEHVKKESKRIFTNRVISRSSNDEQKCERKCDKSLKGQFSDIQEDDSDASSGKEFQKMKLQKVHRDKYSRRQLADLEVDYTESLNVGDFVNDKSKKSNDERLNLNFNDAKKILSECKKICSNFQMYIETIEQLYNKKDKEQLVLKSTEKIGKLKTMLAKKEKDLTTFYHSWSKSRKNVTAKKSRQQVSDTEQSSKETDVRETCTLGEKELRISENERTGSKDVSECDSEEIFSADETRSSQKIQITRDKVDTSKIKNNLNDNDKTIHKDKINDEISIDGSKDKSNVNSQDDSITSPILGVSKEKKIIAERPIRKQLFPECIKNNNNEAQLTNKSTDEDKQTRSNADTCHKKIEIEDSPLRNDNEKVTLQNDKQDNSNEKNIINESTDMFDTSFDNLEVVEKDRMKASKTNVRTDCVKAELSSSKIESLDTRETSLHDKVPSEKNRTSPLSHNNGKEKNLPNQHDQKNVAYVSATNEKIHDDSEEIDTSEKVNIDDIECVDDAEALAKKALLESDSDTDNTNANMAKQIEDLNIDDSDRIEKRNETEGDDPDVNNTGAITYLSKTSKTTRKISVAKNINAKAKIEVEKEGDSRPNKCRKEMIPSDEDAKAEEAAKKALLESSSDGSTVLSLLDSGGLTDEKTDSSSSVYLSNLRENAKAKLALLASSNSESSSSELVLSEIEANIAKNSNNTKRNREPESDGDSLLSRVKKRRVKLDKNYHYRNDKKLRMSCQVHLVRLSEEVLKRYSNALQKSREYLEHKALKSLVNLDKLEKRRKKNAKRDSDSSTDNDASSKISKNSSKRRGKQTTKEESLMDHLKRIENGDVSATVETDASSDESLHRIKRVDDTLVSNEALISEANRIAKERLLNSSDSNEKEVVLDSDDDINNDDKNEKAEDNKKKHHKKSEEKISKQDDSKKDKSDKSNWRRNKILTSKFFDTDSDIEKEKWEKEKQERLAKKSEENNSDSSDEEKGLESEKKKKKKSRRRILDSDSDIKITDCTSDSDNSFEASNAEQNSSDSNNAKKEKEKLKRKRRKRGDSNSSGTDSSFADKKPKRKRIKEIASDSDSSNAEMKNSQGSTPGKSGRKNIRKVLKDKQVAEDTKQAAKEEEERLKRISERQALYNEMYEMRLAGEEKVEKLVLDFDTKTKEELISVHEQLVKRLKPHQAQGIKFMWDACFESLERTKTTSGSGCIIAHCMGLGKTLQVIALTHTLLTHEGTDVKTVLIVCPLSTVLNWLNEYSTWLKDLDDIEVYELTKFKKNFERKYQLQRWQKTGGVMIIGYEMFRNLTGANKNIRKGMKEVILECLVDPGADLIVCDEGHLLKNEDTALSKCMRGVKTMRRIVLTGTPLQNNLIEYHCMVQFVKPNLLGTKREFLNRFVNPITNGQFDDSTAYDVKLMKKRAHVLHKMLEGSVQRFDYSVLTPFLPPKQEYVIFVRLADAQIKMYQYYLDNLARRHSGAGGTLFADFQALQRIWTHPVVLRLNAEKIEKANEKKGLSSESEGSLKDFINDDTTEDESSSSNNDSSSDSDVQAIDDAKENANISKRKTRNNPGEEEPEEATKEEISEAEWWSQFVEPEHFQDMRVSAKLLLLFGILKESEQIGDKVLVFSQSLYSLTLIEEFLGRIDDQTQKGTPLDTLDNHTGSWSLGLDYFRLDGQTSAENRSIWCKIFNKPTNTRARLFLISTRAGGLGINLTAANRVIIFDASWNPSHDVQSIFRIYRFGQKKPCYVYRFLAAGTMEEKIYNRQVTKLSLSCRVVDEQQIERHYSNHNLNELYRFEEYDDKDKRTLNLPKDRLLAEIFLRYKDFVENYHEHDSLLENKAEEELDEEERKQAWLEYEEEKKGRPLVNPMLNSAYQNNIILQQQYNMMMNSGQSGIVPQDMSLQREYENLQQLIRKDYPNATPEQQKMMTNRALVEMYNYWEKQATLYTKQPTRNPAALPNFQQRPIIVSHAASNNNMHQQVSQLNQLLTSGQSGNYVNVNKPGQSSQGIQRGDLLPNPFTYRNVSPANNKGAKTDHDIIEVIPTTSNTGVSNAQAAVQPTDNSKNQEE